MSHGPFRLATLLAGLSLASPLYPRELAAAWPEDAVRFDSALVLSRGEGATVPREHGASSERSPLAGMEGVILPEPFTGCRKASWLVIPAFFVLPETGPGVAMKARARDLFGPGYVDATMAMTWKKQADLELRWLRDSIGGSWRTRQNLEIGRFPSIWYGEGSPPPDSMKARYQPTYLMADSRLARYFARGWALEGSLGLDLEDMDRREEGAFLSSRVVASEGGAFWIAGAALEYDGRDLPENPREGAYLRIQSRTAMPGSYSVWTHWQNDVSHAWSLWRFTTIARVRTVGAWGNVPFWELPALGFRDVMHGLPNRRLRGDAAQCAGAELRFHVPTIWGSQWQLASFLEEGRAGTHRGVWTEGTLPAAGGGVRLVLDGGKAILRADVGASPEGKGIYLDFGQAF